MIALQSDEYFDLNKLGLLVSVLVVILTLTLNISWILKVLSVIYIFLYDIWLFKKIQKNKSIVLSLETSGRWQIKRDDKLTEVKLNDFWKFSGFLCLWLKGEQESLSIVVSRRIIGAQKFSIINIHSN